ncbi:hypothetical protein Ssi03_73710 [Sphaerisporangium siamense]|uniref:Uncharacterized protein n=1 Tax=Sphaerisporangium siamense TaxID=795645 RepID=A0A7W7GBK4_9ACTN|nr:hypothetical protein [Sphaerisporangium siamense]MBB4701081.1 hypothetical protein [Sphaerisporangium siamense]GII89381.1 hypothetical protein Ssi03_73710 [Sphaerisporangium siamense]
MSEQTFIDACLHGDALMTEIDDWIDRWHDCDGEPNGQAESLHDFLGMSWEQYSIFAEKPQALRFIIAARRWGTEVAMSDVALAARSTHSKEANDLIAWLRQTGRIS